MSQGCQEGFDYAHKLKLNAVKLNILCLDLGCMHHDRLKEFLPACGHIGGATFTTDTCMSGAWVYAWFDTDLSFSKHQ